MINSSEYFTLLEARRFSLAATPNTHRIDWNLHIIFPWQKAVPDKLTGDLFANLVRKHLKSLQLPDCFGEARLVFAFGVVQRRSRRHTCRTANSVIWKAWIVALNFALTRPCLGGLAMSLRQWNDVWNACASVVQWPCS